MAETDQERFAEEEKVKILLHEYATLRNEILTRTTNSYQLIASGAAALITLLIVQPWGVHSMLALATVLSTFIYLFFLITRDISKAAKRLSELEQDINRRAGETLLVCESRWGGVVAGHWGRGTPLPRNHG